MSAVETAAAVSGRSAETISVRLRFFAAAEEAVGAPELALELPAGASIGDALAAASPAGTRSAAQAVLTRCSFLLNTRATTDTSVQLEFGDLLDVLPPFAGG